jgi:hypothetical protein
VILLVAGSPCLEPLIGLTTGLMLSDEHSQGRDGGRWRGGRGRGKEGGGGGGGGGRGRDATPVFDTEWDLREGNTAH